MSATPDTFDRSIWTGVEGSENAPKECPHCGRALAHPDDLRDNDSIQARGLFSAWRRHREAHYGWGADPREDGDEYGDPYLGNYYDGDKDATWDPDDDEPAGDPDEIVGHVYEVTIYHEARTTARVVATDEHRAKEKVEYRELPDGKDLNGSIPESQVTHKLHDETREVESVTRADDRAERMAGWPW